MILYSAPSSYYSMIARLALQESKIDYTHRCMDIHLSKEQLSPWYAALNPLMTVPTLKGNDHVWTDSRTILKFAASSVDESWYDSDTTLAPYIEKIVDAHYAISIEKLTFGKIMIKSSLAYKIFIPLLQRIIRQLQAELQNSPDSFDSTALQKKIALNQERLAYFTEGNQLDKLKERKEEVHDYLKQLPQPSTLLFGEKPSSADIVTAVLFSRLKMIGEYKLVTSMPALSSWFERVKDRPAFKNSDIWLSFHLWRIFTHAIASKIRN